MAAASSAGDTANDPAREGMPMRYEPEANIYYFYRMVTSTPQGLDALQKTAQRVKEALKRYPALTEYADNLQFVFHAFYKKGGMVRFDDQLASSNIEPRPLNGERVVNLVIGVKDRTDHLSVIWSAFHEWGHLSQIFAPAEARRHRIDTPNLGRG